MIGALLLMAALAWLAIAGVAGWLLYRWTGRRWVQVIASLFLLWLPFWDVVPGLILYSRAIREVGGVRIHQTVRAAGYLDLSVTDCYSCWSRLQDSNYGYLEVRRTVKGGALAALENGPGFYKYRLLPREDSRCELFESLPNAERIRSNRGLGNWCVTSTFHAEPYSRYELSSGHRIYGHSSLPWPVTIDWSRVRDRVSGEVLAESSQVHFTSWLGRKIGTPHWKYIDQKDGRHIELRMTEVLLPD